MSELETGNESGVESGSPASSESASPAPTQEAGSTQEASSAAQKEPPFHEHPRFKEIIEQNRSYKSQLESMQRDFQAQMAQIQQQYKQSQPQATSFKDEYLGYLKQADPKFAEYQQHMLDRLEKTSGLEQEVAELRQGYQAYQQQQAVSQFDKLCSENKISDTDKDIYKQFVANAANARGSKISDLPSLFKEAHETLGKYFSDKEKAIRESYVKQKTADKKPATTTGGIPASANKGAPTSLDDVKAQFAQALRAAKNI